MVAIVLSLCCQDPADGRGSLQVCHGGAIEDGNRIATRPDIVELGQSHCCISALLAAKRADAVLSGA
jgi:hypothetical protein